MQSISVPDHGRTSERSTGSLIVGAVARNFLCRLKVPQKVSIVSSRFCFVLISLTCLRSLAAPIDIGSRLELLVDRFLIERMDEVEFKLHRPVRLPKAKQPLPANRHYITVLKDGDRFRAYWRGSNPDYGGAKEWFAKHPEQLAMFSGRTGMDPKKIVAGQWFAGNPGEHVRYAESKDGHEWVFPKLGLHKMGGTKQNNVLLNKQPPLLTNFAPFIDQNPDAPKSERYKSLGGHPGYRDKRGGEGAGLHAFVSADGLTWKMIGEVIPYPKGAFHAFDSQNVSFWSEAEQQYVCFFRTWAAPWGRQLTISKTTSKDFRTWTAPIFVGPNRKGEDLYTSQTHPYFRAPHIYIALPTRFFKARGSITDIGFMTMRAGSDKYDRLFPEAFIRPGLDQRRWDNRSNYVANNVWPTGRNEMSIWHRSGHRYVLRTDGFISVNAGVEPGELLTKPFRFSGDQLRLNVSTSAAGSVRVEISDAEGKPIPGFRLTECDPVMGDAINYPVSCKGSKNLRALAGRSIRIRFILEEADLYALQFAKAL